MIGSSGSALAPRHPPARAAAAPIRTGTVGRAGRVARAGSAPARRGRASRSRGRPARRRCITSAWCAAAALPERGRHRIVGRAAGHLRPLAILGGQHAELLRRRVQRRRLGQLGEASGPPRSRPVRGRAAARTRGRRSRPALHRAVRHRRSVHRSRAAAAATSGGGRSRLAAAARRQRRATGPRGRIRRRKPGDSDAPAAGSCRERPRASLRRCPPITRACTGSVICTIASGLRPERWRACIDPPAERAICAWRSAWFARSISPTCCHARSMSCSWRSCTTCVPSAAATRLRGSRFSSRSQYGLSLGPAVRRHRLAAPRASARRSAAPAAATAPSPSGAPARRAACAARARTRCGAATASARRRGRAALPRGRAPRAGRVSARRGARRRDRRCPSAACRPRAASAGLQHPDE